MHLSRGIYVIARIPVAARDGDLGARRGRGGRLAAVAARHQLGADPGARRQIAGHV